MGTDPTDTAAPRATPDEAAGDLSPWSTRPDPEAERRAKRMAVLRSAARQFNEKGFRATSMDDVATALQVTKPTIYHYFASKDEILFECVRLGLSQIREGTTGAAERGGTGLERMQAMVHAYALSMTHDFGICVSRTGDAELSPESRAKFRALKREIDDIVREIIEAGIEDGSMRSEDPKIATFLVAGAINWIARWYRPDGARTREEIADFAVQHLTRALAA
ncbi:TetR/AcrR family transcriptional regulator [Chachezhania sediminis]|uniref:TetR/AcrR family transcriptional regulator n=1 Tax=Chachezhania sediminis TaxID=2599291 RepID=UPI00131EC3DD|nr:TetR/AcrR family transcriptional regulator [Chachezhania sediminis]